MKDLKKDARSIENKGKEMARKIDGDESMKDKLGNLGDDVRHGVGNAGDEVREEVDKVAKDLERRTREEESRVYSEYPKTH
jgi:Skp family chaperone for outer membrane proteins